MPASASTPLLEPGELGPVQDVSEGALHFDLAAHRNCACFGNETAARNIVHAHERVTLGETLRAVNFDRNCLGFRGAPQPTV